MKQTAIITKRSQLEELSPCRIGFLGGSFNPVHDGHIALAEHVLENYIDHVVFCPHSLHPEKKDILVSIEHRIKMIMILKEIARYSKRIHIIHPSFVHGTHGLEFIELCRYIKNRNIGSAIVCGTDCFSRPYFPDLCNFDHYIGIRVTDHSKEKIQKLLTGKTVFFDTPFAELSSTNIRSMVSEKKMHVIHRHLREYIMENKLFEFSNDHTVKNKEHI